MWEAYLLDKQSNVTIAEDINSENLHPMGLRNEIIFSFKKLLKGRMLDSHRIEVRSGNFDIHFDIGLEDPVKSIKLITNGEIYYVLLLLHEKFLWKTFDPVFNEYIDLTRGKNDKKEAETPIRALDSNNNVFSILSAFIKYLGIITSLLMFDFLVRPHIEASLAKGLFSTGISIIVLVVLYKFGYNNGFIKAKYGLLMSGLVSLILIAINITNNWSIIPQINNDLVKALSFAFILKALIYYLFILMGIKIRISREEGEQTLEFKWR